MEFNRNTVLLADRTASATALCVEVAAGTILRFHFEEMHNFRIRQDIIDPATMDVTHNKW